jgi:hypothetical protein
VKIFTFGVGIDTHYPGAKHGDVPETWVTQAQANNMVDQAMREKGIFGLKYASRADAEKAIVAKLYDKKTGISVSGEPVFSREDRNLGPFFVGSIAGMGLLFGLNRLKRGL